MTWDDSVAAFGALFLWIDFHGFRFAAPVATRFRRPFRALPSRLARVPAAGLAFVHQKWPTC